MKPKRPFTIELMERGKICPCCGGEVCDRCGNQMRKGYEWSDCTTEYYCPKCDRKYYEYYAGKPDYKGGSIQKLWFALMKRYWREVV